jgi:exodeoxyribonuclease-3
MIKISTWNVNSIRARIFNLIDWLKNTNPDVVLLQELKCADEQFPILELSNLNYNIIFKGQKSYNGVAIMSKFPLYDTNYNLPTYNIVENDKDSRYIEARFDHNGTTFKVSSVYVPNGGTTEEVDDITETEKFYSKIKFYRRLKQKFDEDIKNQENVIYGGDFNVCPNLYMDVYSVKKDGSITCHAKERTEFAEFLKIGMHDVFREKNKDLMEFTWWGYRPFSMFEKNQGFRIDAILTNDISNKYVKDCFIEREIRKQERPSDHAPMSMIME